MDKTKMQDAITEIAKNTRTRIFEIFALPCKEPLQDAGGESVKTHQFNIKKATAYG